jgi:hypothetical protein
MNAALLITASVSILILDVVHSCHCASEQLKQLK